MSGLGHCWKKGKMSVAWIKKRVLRILIDRIERPEVECRENTRHVRLTPPKPRVTNNYRPQKSNLGLTLLPLFDGSTCLDVLLEVI